MTAASLHDSRYGFVPPGHRAIMVFLVLHAWLHPSGAWLSIQQCGKVVALVWRTSDSWKATAQVVHVLDEFATLEENYEAAFRMGELLVTEGPQSALLASAAKSKEVRTERGKAAAAARWKKSDCKDSGRAPNLKIGPDVDRKKWRWKLPHGDFTAWSLELIETPDVWLTLWEAGSGTYKLEDEWNRKTVLEAASLTECFSAMEDLARREPEDWWSSGNSESH